MIIIKYTMNTIVHNFCESRLNDNQPPEIMNSLTALFMFYLPFIFKFPKHYLLSNVIFLLQINGIASCYYHFSLNWIGKQLDEISMILANFFGLWALLNIYNIWFYNKLNILYMMLCISINTISSMDVFFPILFGIYMILTIYMIMITSFTKSNVFYIGISIIGFISWLISEIYCNKYTYLGHCIWHIMFPLGFYRIIMQYDYLLI